MKKIIYTILLFVVCLSLTACSDTNNAQTSANINQTITKINATVKKLTEITNSDLIINDFMPSSILSQNNSVYRNSSYSIYDENCCNYSFSPQNQMDIYVAKLQSLSNLATCTISANNEMEYTKSNILNRTSYLNLTLGQIKDKKCKITDAQKTAIYDLCNSIAINLNRIDLSKNELKQELNGVCVLKNNYTSNIDQLCSKYTRLLNCLETRISYLRNISNSTLQLQNILDSIYFPCSSEKDSQQQALSGGFKSNIDTYSNANPTNSTTENNSNKNHKDTGNYSQNPNYYNNPGATPFNNPNGHGWSNPHFNNGFFNRFGTGFGFGGYPFSPYSNYNPYMPNVDTFGSYKNTDTYRARNYNEANNHDESNYDSEEESETKETNASLQNSYYSENENNKLKDFQNNQRRFRKKQIAN